MNKSYIELNTGGTASKRIYSKVFKRANKVAASLDPQRNYRIKDLFGKKVWKRLSLADRCDAEKCMVDFTVNQEVMFDYIGTSRSNFALFKPA